MKKVTYYIYIIVGMLILIGCSKVSVEEELIQAANSFALKSYKITIVQTKGILKDNPDNIEARILLAKAYQVEGLFTNAEKEWQILLKKNININIIARPYLEALYALNDTLAISDLWEKQKKDLTDENKAYATIIVSLASLESSIEESRLIIEQGTEFADKSNNKEAIVILNALKSALSNSTKTQQIADLVQACEQFPNNWIICTLSANAQIVNGHIEEATKTLEQLVTLLPYHYRPMIILAESYIKLNNKDKASFYLNKLLQLFPKQAYINQLMAMYNLQNANFEVALTHINIAISQGLSTSQTKLIAGLANYQLESYEQALSSFSSLRSNFPNNDYITKMIVATQLKLRNPEAVYDELSGIELTESNTRMIAMASLELLKAGAKKESTQLLNKVDIDSISDINILTSINLAKIANGDSSSIDNIENIIQNLFSDQEDGEKGFDNSKYLLISSFITTNQIPRAKKQIDEWISQSPQNVDNYLLKAEILKRDKEQDLDVISGIYQKVLLLDANNIMANINLAFIFYQKKNFEQATEHFKETITHDKFNIQALKGYYLSGTNLGKGPQVLKEIEKILVGDSKEPKHRLMLAQIFLISKNYNNAIELLSNYNFKEPRNINTSHLILADTFLSLEEYEKAIELYNVLLLNNEIDYNVLKKKLYAHEKTNSWLLAETDLKKLHLLHPNDTAIILSLANIQVLINKPLEALTNIEKLDVKHPLINSIKGSALHRANRFTEALPYLKTAYQAEPQSRISAMLFESLIATNENEQAIKHIKSHLAEFSDDTSNRVLYAFELAKTDRESAIDEYIQVLNIQKNNVVVLNNLAWTLYKEKQFKRAEFYIDKAKLLAPKSANINDSYQKIKSAIKDNDKVSGK